MPPIKKFQKEDIINATYKIVRIEGMEAVNARRIAKELNCSIQPIFHNFTTMEELKTQVYEKILETYHNYMLSDIECEYPYRQTGKNYIKFAREESKLFQMIFMSPTNLPPEKFMLEDSNFKNIEKFAGDITKLSTDRIKEFHTKMWIFTHGIATLMASKTCEFTESQIDKLLVDEYQALIKLENSN